MCRRGALALAIALAGPAVAQGQSAEAWGDSVARLRAETRALRDSMTSGDSTASEVARRGSLVMSSTPHLRAAAMRALDRFVASRTRWFGSSSPSPFGFRIVLRSQVEFESRGQPGSRSEVLILVELPDSGRWARTERVMARREIDNPETVAGALLNEFGTMMYRDVPAALKKWLPTQPPFYMAEHERRVATMYDFVTGPGSAQRACVSGRIADCAYTVNLRPPVRPDPGGGYSEFARADLLLTALEIGGPEAWGRLRTASGDSVEALLSAAAGMPGDTLLARWRERLLAIKPTESPIGARQAVLVIGWTALILLGALGLSRWA